MKTAQRTPVSQEEVERLERFDSHGARVLSVYLDLDPQRQVDRSYLVVLKDLIRETRDRLDEAAGDELSKQAGRLEEWLESEQPQGRGLAVFSCSDPDLWYASYLPVPVTDHLAFEPRPHLGPLLALLDEYERYEVALVDKEKARLFSVFMGTIDESEGFEDAVPGKHDQGGWSQARLQRHHETHVYQHLQHVTERLGELLERKRFDRLILAGPEEATNELRGMLPHVLSERLVATIPAEMFAGEAEILEQSQAVAERFEREEEGRVVDAVLDEAGADGASCGLVPTLEAIWQARVQTLLVAEGTEQEGSECQECGRLQPGHVAPCPACGGPMVPLVHLVERAMERTRGQGGEIEIVRGDPAERLRERCEGVGALYRFRAAEPPESPEADRTGS
jgi:peptide chain release factor subunit 1